MSSTTPLTDAINALTTYANEVTGKNNTNLSDAVATLASGYGGGGGFLIDDFIERSNVTGDVAYSGSETSLPPGAFAYTGITSFTSSVINNIEGDSQFDGCRALTSVSIPNLAPNANNKGANMFRNCTSLASVYLPKWTRGGGNTFQYCTSLETLVLPAVNYTLPNYFANGCTRLTTVDIGGNIGGTLCGGNAFTNTAISTLILRRTAGVVGTAANNFSNGATFTCYVPSALIASYQAATNWSSKWNITWEAIEGSIYETKYADGTPISTT